MPHPCENPVEIWPIDRPKPNPDNARIHSDEQVRQLANSIKGHKLNRPLLADENDVILAGHGLWLALRSLDYKEVPVQALRHLSASEKRTFLIADNQLAATSIWDEEKLGRTLLKLETELVNLDVVGFSPKELDRLLADLQPEDLVGEPEEDPPEEPTLVVTLPGDLWLAGRHTILCADSLLDGSADRALKGQRADMAFCDPPYNCDLGRRNGKRTITNDNLGANFPAFLEAACAQILSATKGGVYICMSSAEIPTLTRAFKGAGGHWSTYVIWHKDHFTLGRSDYQRQFEMILYGFKEGKEHYWSGARDEGDVWSIPKPKTNHLHPTMKPVALVERAIRNSSPRGGLVLDLFGGAGSTLIAAEKSGRRAAIVEIEPKYIDVMIQRWQKYTGQEARLEGDGRTFQQVSNARLLVAA